MALSFGESLKKVQAETKSAVISAKPVYEAYDTEAYNAENIVSDQPDLSLPYSDKYVKYTEYYDPNFSIIDENKNITLDSSQINLTQEENSQYIPFKMFRRYDNIDQLNMTLLMHCVTPLGGDVYVTPVNVQYDDSYLYFGVIIPASVCATKGEVLFEIQSIGTNEKGDSYKLITRNSKFNVEESLSGNGTVEPTPDTGWMMTFLKQVTEEVGKAQTAANEAKESAKEAKASADKLQGTIDNAKEELSTSLDTRIASYLLSYYTKTEVDNLLKNIDLTDVYNKINSIDGLAKFNVEYNSDTRTMSFYNGDKKIKDIVLNTDPSAEWVVSYGKVVDGKISTATTPIQKSLDSFKSTVNSDLQAIHKNIDDLPETLKTKYYDKDATNQLLTAKADASDVSNLSTKIGVVEQTASSNKSSIAAVGTKVASLEDTIGKLSTDPGKTYDATYSDDNIYTLWEIEKEGTEEEQRTQKATFKISGGGGGGWGIVRISLQTNNSSSVSTVEAKWLARCDLKVDCVQIGLYNVFGKTYADAFFKTSGTYAGTVIRNLASGARGNISRTWTLINSAEANGTTTSDKKASTESYVSTSAAATTLHSQAYTSVVVASDGGTVSYANSAGNASKVNNYTVNSNVPSGAKFTDTVYSHPTTSGNKHIPSGGSSGQILRWSSDGTAVWGNDNNTTYTLSSITGTLAVSKGGTGSATAARGRFNLGAVGFVCQSTEPSGQNNGDIWFKEE